ncbi:hypothetical protein B0H13DRAFT_2549458 [Mycena leptocephala]|nr:hypothetical protein B0H13DRAFT_2549458 [Mycena leptocephala]
MRKARAELNKGRGTRRQESRRIHSVNLVVCDAQTTYDVPGTTTFDYLGKGQKSRAEEELRCPWIEKGDLQNPRARILEADGRAGSSAARCIGQLPRLTETARIWNPNLAATRSTSRFHAARRGAESCNRERADEEWAVFEVKWTRASSREEPKNEGSRMAAGTLEVPCAVSRKQSRARVDRWGWYCSGTGSGVRDGETMRDAEGAAGCTDEGCGASGSGNGSIYRTTIHRSRRHGNEERALRALCAQAVVHARLPDERRGRRATGVITRCWACGGAPASTVVRGSQEARHRSRCAAGNEGEVGDGERRLHVRRTPAKVLRMRPIIRIRMVAGGVALTLSGREDLMQAAPAMREVRRPRRAVGWWRSLCIGLERHDGDGRTCRRGDVGREKLHRRMRVIVREEASARRRSQETAAGAPSPVRGMRPSSETGCHGRRRGRAAGDAGAARLQWYPRHLQKRDVVSTWSCAENKEKKTDLACRDGGIGKEPRGPGINGCSPDGWAMDWPAKGRLPLHSELSPHPNALWGIFASSTLKRVVASGASKLHLTLNRCKRRTGIHLHELDAARLACRSLQLHGCVSSPVNRGGSASLLVLQGVSQAPLLCVVLEL